MTVSASMPTNISASRNVPNTVVERFCLAGVRLGQDRTLPAPPRRRKHGAPLPVCDPWSRRRSRSRASWDSPSSARREPSAQLLSLRYRRESAPPLSVCTRPPPLACQRFFRAAGHRSAAAPMNSNRPVISKSPRKKIQVMETMPASNSQKPSPSRRAAQRSSRAQRRHHIGARFSEQLKPAPRNIPARECRRLSWAARARSRARLPPPSCSRTMLPQRRSFGAARRQMRQHVAEISSAVCRRGLSLQSLGSIRLPTVM